LFIYFLLIVFSACTSLKKKQPHFQHTRNMDRILQSYEKSMIPYQNFVHLNKLIMTRKLANGETEYCKSEEDNCDSITEYTSASGIVVNKDKNKLKILTVDHWCSESMMESLSLMYRNEEKDYIMPDLLLEVAFYGKTYRAKILEVDQVNDICLLEIESEFAYKAKNINIAKVKPKIGEKVYAISSPAGVSSHKIRLEFHGNWAGCDDELTYLPYCYFTIPAAPGSSGSGVFNAKGELVSLISISMTGFDQISGGPRQFFMKELIKY
jgi:hypothetical protein